MRNRIFYLLTVQISQLCLMDFISICSFPLSAVFCAHSFSFPIPFVWSGVDAAMVSRLFIATFVVLLVWVANSQPTPPPSPFDQPGGITILLNGVIFTPLPRTDLFSVVMSDRSILAMLNQSATNSLLSTLKASGIVMKVVDCNGGAIVPGLIDVHVHVTGGGGELGPYSRTPEAQVSQLVNAGLTTVVGLLGTDTISRSMPNLLAKLRALQTDGISTYMWTGGYHYPVSLPVSQAYMLFGYCSLMRCLLI
jgi:hypothetical protein